MKTKFLSVSVITALVLILGAPGFTDQVIKLSDYKETIRVVCVGDSITFGAGVENRETNCYPAVLGKLLGNKFDVKNYGDSGTTLLRKGDHPYRIEPAVELNPHVVIVKLGTNDTKPQNWAHKEDFAKDLRDMLDTFAKCPAKPKIWVCLPVPVYKANWGINEPVLKDEVIPIIKKVAQEKHLAVIDLHTALSNHADMFPDGVHPNAAGAALIAKAVQAALLGQKP